MGDLPSYISFTAFSQQAVACTLQIQPCHAKSHGSAICRLDVLFFTVYYKTNAVIESNFRILLNSC